MDQTTGPHQRRDDATVYGAGPAPEPSGGLWPSSRRHKLEEDLAHVNRQIYGKNLELAQTNKTLALLRAIDSLVLTSSEELRSLCSQLSRKVVETMEFPFVGIMGLPGGHDDHSLAMYGWSSLERPAAQQSAILNRLHFTIDESWKQGDVFSCIDLNDNTDVWLAGRTDASAQDIAWLRKSLHVSSACAIRLRVQQRFAGIMIIGFGKIQQDFNQAERDLFVRLGEAVGIAVDHKLLFEENQRSMLQLAESNRRLRLMDQTKDDFISMASHQLRTPLTSVKGYISMVLDGDGGPLTDLQRRLLNQSFVSSQRMVYLISDLLNVSRLRTGKFVIEPIKSNLAAVVQSEVDQLKETAKSRKLSLVYDKPAEFPDMQLDESKLRQAIMNFIDNAIYYTPEGGHITVTVNDKPQAIECLVADDGIGVPRAEQHNIFSKFFRAQNARRARPDGTGLGLFMAKKVIAAHGGAVIFKSQEGVGSTFGFSIPKANLQPTHPAAPPQLTGSTSPSASPKQGLMH